MGHIINGPIPRLMDALGGLDLYWKSLQEGNARMNDSSATAWLLLANILENNVKEVRDINADRPDTHHITSVNKLYTPSSRIPVKFKCPEQCCRRL
jgi:hypothetical protein